MLFGVLGACCFCAGGFASARLSVAWGPAKANFFRLLTSLSLLALGVLVTGWAISAPSITALPVWVWLALAGAGALHFGIGDTGLMIAYRTLGPRRALVLAMVGATMTAVAMDSVLAGRLPTLWQALLLLMAIFGTFGALDRQTWMQGDVRLLRRGIVAAAVAALGQGAANAVAAQAIAHVPLWQATGLRLLGALPIAVLVLVLLPMTPQGYAQQPGHRRGKSLLPIWLGVSALIGPILGISAINAGLAAEGGAMFTQAALMLLPLLMVPVAWMMDGDRPQRRALVSLVCVVASLLILALSSSM